MPRECLLSNTKQVFVLTADFGLVLAIIEVTKGSSTVLIFTAKFDSVLPLQGLIKKTNSQIIKVKKAFADVKVN